MDNLYSFGRSLDFKLLDADLNKGMIKAAFAAFGNIDDGGDVLFDGACNKSIAERGPNSMKPRIKHFLDHNPTAAIGVPSELKEEGGYLVAVSSLGSHSLGKDAAKMYADGIITEHSIGYQKAKFQPNKSGGYDLFEIKLWEISSLQAWGMNPNTPVLKSISDAHKYITIVDNWQKALKSGTYTDETFEQLELQYLQMKTMLNTLISLSQVEPPQSTHQQEPISSEKAAEFLKSITELSTILKK